MITIKKINPTNTGQIVDLAVSYLKDGKILIYPTDTSYGIGGIYTNEYTINKISRLKNRVEGKYYSVIIPNIEWAIQNLEVNTLQKSILNKYLPGEYTFILEDKTKSGNLAIRIPNQKLLNLIASRLNLPFTATSANISNQPDAYSLEDLKLGILNQSIPSGIDILVLDGGQLKKGSKSTIVDLTQKPAVILRQGSGIFKE